MNIYARIRKIEDTDLFKRFFDTLMSSVHKNDFEPTKEGPDFGIDGYLKSKKIAYQVYCPKYPERRSQQQYKTKILNDINKLKKALDEKKVTLGVEEWCFVTPDDLSVEIKDYIKQQTETMGWRWSTLTAQNLAPYFMDQGKIHKDFPEITAGMQYDRIPSVYAKFINNKGYPALEIFNNGTEAIQDLEVETSQDQKDWQSRNAHFLFDFDNPREGYMHTCFTLKMGERQYISNVPRLGKFHYKITGVGTESGKTFYIEGFVEPITP